MREEHLVELSLAATTGWRLSGARWRALGQSRGSLAIYATAQSVQIRVPKVVERVRESARGSHIKPVTPSSRSRRAGLGKVGSAAHDTSMPNLSVHLRLAFCTITLGYTEFNRRTT